MVIGDREWGIRTGIQTGIPNAEPQWQCRSEGPSHKYTYMSGVPGGTNPPPQNLGVSCQARPGAPARTPQENDCTMTPLGGNPMPRKVLTLRPKGRQIFRSFWDRFGIVLGSFWDRCGILVAAFWNHFGISFGNFFSGHFFLGVDGSHLIQHGRQMPGVRYGSFLCVTDARP